MSRAPPFPTRRARSPSLTNGNGIPASPFPAPTRPLQINRPTSRPTTPNNSSFMSSSPRGPNTASGGPSRPQRSELRSRQVSEYSDSGRTSTSSRATADSSYYRDSITTTRSDGFRPRNGTSTNTGTPPSSRSKPNRLRSAPPEEPEITSPAAISSVMSAFQAAGARKRAMTNGSEDMAYERDQRRAAEEEKLRQQRIRERTPGRRQTNGKTRAGDIDGMYGLLQCLILVAALKMRLSIHDFCWWY